MPSDLASFLYGTLGGSVAAIAGVKLLGEWFVQHRLAKAIKDHEARLAEKADVLKTQLSIYAHEQNTAVARVDSQRAKSLHAIYATIRAWSTPDRKSTRLNSSHVLRSRMPSSA